MRISFINPNLNGSVLLNAGLAYLQGYIQQFHKTQLVDLTFHRKDWKNFVRNKILKFNPDVIGFTSTTFEYYDSIKVLDYIQSFYPNAKFILGGIHSTLMHNEVISNSKYDALIIGEGEIPLKNYLDSLDKGKEVINTKGIWFKEKNGKIIRNEYQLLQENIDEFPFAAWEHWELPFYFKYSTHYNKILISGSRGCPYSCNFCSNAALRKIMPGKYVRYRSAEKIIDEINQLKDRYYKDGFRFLFFTDDTFGLNKKIFNNLMNLLKTENISDEIHFQAFARFDTINEEWIRKVGRSGCYLLSFGIESANEYIRNEILGKRFSNQRIIDINKILVKNKIARLYYYMIGVPGDTVESIRQSFTFNKKLNPEFFNFFIFQPLPNTEILNNITKYQGDIDQMKWLSTGELFQPSFVNTKYLNSKDLNRLLFRLNLKHTIQMTLGSLKRRRLGFIKDVKDYLDVNFLQLNMRIQNLAVKTYFRYRIEDLALLKGIDLRI